MKQLRKLAGRWAAAFGILSVALWLAGCGTTPDFDEGLVQIKPRPGATNSAQPRPSIGGEVFHPGDSVIITFAGMDPPLPTHTETIKDDGTIRPPLVKSSVKAADKTPGELQRELQAEYEKIFQHPTITVQATPRYYYVTGDVIKPGPQQILNETDLVMAISAAGGFTEFANRKHIQITRAGARKPLPDINYNEAVRDPKKNVRIYPNDTIFVPRSAF